MSDELNDEIEAINSIYGEGSLSVSDDPSTYVLKLPGDASSLKLQFPASYPAEPPSVLGTHHASGGVKGAGARDLQLFTQAVGSVFNAGVVCLFDAVEEFSRLLEETQEPAVEEESPAEIHAKEEEEVDPVTEVNPEWIYSEVVTELKSTFVARVARVTSADEAALYVRHLLATDKKARAATHNVTAWRVRGAGGTSFQDCDDDGEAAAGGRLLHLMQLMDVWDAVVVVTRWYGGVKLGPRRFAVMNGVARDALVRGGWGK